jgi:hypothetical protein
MPNRTCAVDKFKFKSGSNCEFNGYSKDDVIEGRTDEANYKRLLVRGVRYMAMTRFAYDCKFYPHSVHAGECIKVLIWSAKHGRDPLLNALNHDDITGGGSVRIIKLKYYSLLDCHEVYLDPSVVTKLTKSEADEYLKEHPKTIIFKKA